MAGEYAREHRAPRVALHVSPRGVGPRADPVRLCRHGRDAGPAPARADTATRAAVRRDVPPRAMAGRGLRDRKSTRLNSSHQIISYAVLFLQKKSATTCTTST